ncbi:right-handed parallel beta-helix repeat-containing protein [bacterium]|nr:right-handed parallel beta-helix repeat-containing protein [bacterium]
MNTSIAHRYAARDLCRFILLCLLAAVPLTGQPSGGPYGPLRLTYELPEGPGGIIHVSPDGKAESSGKTVADPTTLESAIERAVAGDAIILRGGVYRTGNLVINQGITLQPYADEQPVLKGTAVATDWTNLGNGLWTTPWSRLFPAGPADWWRRNREGKKTPLHRFNNDMVFVDGEFLQSAGWEGEVDAHSFFIDYEAGLVYIGADPADRLVEITAFDIALRRTTAEVRGRTPDRKGPVIRGITFTQYAYRALEVEGTEPEGVSDESQYGKDVVGTTLEHCTISFCSRVAAYLRGDRLTIRHCRVSDTSTEGIYIIASSDVLLEKNIFTRNNMENITGYYPAAVKIFNQSNRVTCRDNLVMDLPNSNGIWYDVGNADGVFVNNRVEGVGRIDRPFPGGNLWPSDSGFFFEISKGAVCAGNVFINCDHGIFVLNSSNVVMAQNTLVNSALCVGRNARVAAGDHFGWHASTGPDVDARDSHVMINNLLAGEEGIPRPLVAVWQPASLCEKLPKPLFKRMDHNAYIRHAGSASDPLILWSPAANEACQSAFASLEDLKKACPEFEVHGLSSDRMEGAVFRSPELGNYQTLKTFQGSSAATRLPKEIADLLGPAGKAGAHIGAYPH